MHTLAPPTLETFSHWPSWQNAYRNLDRSACFELRVAQVRRLAGCIPLRTGPTGKVYENNRKRPSDVPDLPNERSARTVQGRISRGYYDITTLDLDWLARQQFPRRLRGDWRTGRAPAMRRTIHPKPAGDARMEEYAADDKPGEDAIDDAKRPGGRRPPAVVGMTLEQGGHGPGLRAYERKLANHAHPEPLPAPQSMPPGLPDEGLDAGLGGNPNRGAMREKRFGLDRDWTQRLLMEKHRNASVSGRRYFLVCPCGKTAYKLFWVLGRPGEHRDALLAEQWIASLTSSALSRQSAHISALIDRYGPIMGDDRELRCRHCLDMKYAKSPELSRRNNLRRRRRRKRQRAGNTGPRPYNLQHDDAMHES